jgi:hypothetical protein
MSYNIEQINSGFVSLTSGAIAAGTTAGTFKTTATITFTNNGIFKSKSATNNLTFSSGHTALGNSQACLFGLWLDASGNVTTSQGPIVAAGDPCPVPGAPAANRTPFGLIKVSTSSSETFTPGTSTLGTGNTAAYTDISAMPGSAQ